MMKKLSVLFVMIALLVPTIGKVHAQDDSIISFEGEAEKFIYRNNDGEVFGGFKNLYPGEERTETLTLVNNDYRELRFYMSTHILKQFGTDISNGIAYDVKIKINGEELFGGKVGGENNVAISDQESENALIATLKKGERAVMEMTLKTDGDSMDNAYQGATGTVQYKFSVEADDEKAPVVNTVVNKVVNTIINPIKKIVMTEDTTSLTFLGILLAASVVGIGYVIVTKKKKEEKENEEK